MVLLSPSLVDTQGEGGGVQDCGIEPSRDHKRVGACRFLNSQFSIRSPPLRPVPSTTLGMTRVAGLDDPTTRRREDSVTLIHRPLTNPIETISVFLVAIESQLLEGHRERVERELDVP